MSGGGLFLKVAFAVSAAVLAVSAAPAPVLTESLPVLLQRGADAFSSGRWAQAADAWAAVEATYGTGDDWKAGALPRRLLPLRGYAELQAGRAPEALRTLTVFLERFPDETRARPLALYSAAIAGVRAGDVAAARRWFLVYEKENPDSAQAQLARWQRAELALDAGAADEGRSLLEGLAADGVLSPAVALQARLRLLRLALDSGDLPRVRALLLGSPWPPATMPEVGVLSLSALEAGDKFLAGGDAEAAIRAYRHVRPLARLIDEQAAAVEALRGRLTQGAAVATRRGQGAWVDFHTQRLARLERQLEALRAAADYTPALRLRQAQALLVADRPHEAWLVAEQTALREDVAPEVREEAHYRWALAASALEEWGAVLDLARHLRERFPLSAHTPELLFLTAQAHLGQMRDGEAEVALGELVEGHPGHPLAARSRFLRGWCRARREAFAEAREDFSAVAAEAGADEALRMSARLWHALTRTFERDHAAALREWESLAEAVRGRPLEGEVAFRRAATLHALGDAVRAREAAEAFVRERPLHARWPDALALVGDLQLGAGQLREAVATFARIPQTHPLRVYGVFQAGKALRALEAHGELAAHFASYIEVPAGEAPRARTSEALYWIGWARAQIGRPDEARPVFEQALAAHGDNPAATEIATILTALRTLDRRADPGAFDLWLEAERRRALEASRFTWWSRLTLFQAEQRERAGLRAQATELKLDVARVAPVEALDAPALGRVGMALQEIRSPEAARYFDALLEGFPRDPDRAYAYLGSAGEARARGDLETARKWLARLEAELPAHPLAVRGLLALGAVLKDAGDARAATGVFEDVLRRKSARGRPHAEALAGLAESFDAGGEPGKAVAAWQRLYTLHLAQQDLAARGYVESARLLAVLGDRDAAWKTLQELDAQSELASAAASAGVARVREEVGPAPVAGPAPSPSAMEEGGAG